MDTDLYPFLTGCSGENSVSEDNQMAIYEEKIKNCDSDFFDKIIGTLKKSALDWCLINSLRNKNEKMVEYFIDRVNIEEFHENLLYFATKNKNVNLIKKIAPFGSVNYDGIRATVYDHDDSELLNLFKSYGMISQDQDLFYAAIFGLINSFKYLLSCGYKLYNDVAYAFSDEITEIYLRAGNWITDVDEYKFFHVLDERHLDYVNKNNHDLIRILTKKFKRDYSYQPDILFVCQ